MIGANIAQSKLAIVGLGYVGLPLAVEFGKHLPTIGFDINESRIKQLADGHDSTLEVGRDELSTSSHLAFSSDISDLAACNVYIVTVPTPIDAHKQPDLRPLISASKALGGVLGKGDLVIYESTVYPGATEEQCVPVLEKSSGLLFNKDFFVGYSPERINPGDKAHRLPGIMKITSGSTPETAKFVDLLYRQIITAGTHKAESIKVAEAAKVIENTQRDLNVALVNELAIIFDRLGIDTEAVLKAAGTKWNFLPFRPGLVGGHCIGVDPYYLTHKSQASGYSPEIILAGRRINDEMGIWVVNRLIREMIIKGVRASGARVLLLGITFKENCPDVRNTRAVDIVRELEKFGITVDVYDPWADPGEVHDEYGISLVENVADNAYSAIVLAVAHDDFKAFDKEWTNAKSESAGSVVFDLKHVLPKEAVDLRL